MKNIEIGIGIGELKFGMSPESVVKILGEPDEKNREEYSKEDPSFFSEEWHYDDLEMSMSFDMLEKMELSTISVSSSEFTIGGKALIGESRPIVEQAMKELEINSKWEEFKEVEENSDLLTNEDEGLSLWFENGVLREISWEVL